MVKFINKVFKDRIKVGEVAETSSRETFSRLKWSFVPRTRSKRSLTSFTESFGPDQSSVKFKIILNVIRTVMGLEALKSPECCKSWKLWTCYGTSLAWQSQKFRGSRWSENFLYVLQFHEQSNRGLYRYFILCFFLLSLFNYNFCHFRSSMIDYVKHIFKYVSPLGLAL